MVRMDRSWACDALSIQAHDYFLGQSGLKASIEHRISVRVLSVFARAASDRHKDRPIGFVIGVLRAVGGVGVRLLESGQVSVIPSEGRVQLGVVNRVEIGLHFAFADLRLRQLSRLVPQVEAGIGSGIERESSQWVRREHLRSSLGGKHEAQNKNCRETTQKRHSSHIGERLPDQIDRGVPRRLAAFLLNFYFHYCPHA